MPKKEVTDITVFLHHETEKAYLVSDDEVKKIWLPKSQCEMNPNVNGTFTLTGPIWLLKEKELI